MAQWPVPTCVRDIQAFLGLANFYHWFVRRFADIAHPLTDLTRKDIEFVWSAECAALFEMLKMALTTAPVLQVFDDAKPSELWVDASQFAVGATLVQPGDDGKMLPVEYLSHRLSAAECNYDATNHEFVAILAGLQALASLFGGHEVHSVQQPCQS